MPSSWAASHAKLGSVFLAAEMNEVKKTSVGRVESFKTSLTKQKQKLAKQTQVRLKWNALKLILLKIIQIQNQFDKTKIDNDLKKKEEEEKSTKVTKWVYV